jgi:hypothetical protein
MYATEVYNLLVKSAETSRKWERELNDKAFALEVEAKRHRDNANYHSSVARQYNALAIQVEQANIKFGANPGPTTRN